MTGAQLVRIANARTMAALVREGMEVPIEAARTLGAAWHLFLEELAANGMRAEWVGSAYVIRAGAPRPITEAEVKTIACGCHVGACECPLALVIRRD